MYIKEITVSEFNEFAKDYNYNGFRQSLSYALLKAEHEYEYEIIGFTDGENIYAAAVVLVKIIAGYLYAYVPEGFLIDYEDENLLYNFTENLYKYYKKENIAFIKINPQIIVGKIDEKNYQVTYNDNLKINDILKRCGYTKLDNNMNFESALPRVNALVDLSNYSFSYLKKNTKNKVRKALRKGLTIEKADSTKLNILNKFVKAKKNKDDYYYKDYYNVFKRDENIDFFLVSIDYKKYIENSHDAYENELHKNEYLNEKVRFKPGPRNINKKMNSDKTLLSYKNDISIASKKLNEEESPYIAGALVITSLDKATVVISGFDKKYKDFAPNYFLFYSLLEYYKDKVHYLDLNGLTADLSSSNKYHGLNRFKLGFNPEIYEYIGEFDLVINKKVYNYLIKKELLNKEFTQ